VRQSVGRHVRTVRRLTSSNIPASFWRFRHDRRRSADSLDVVNLIRA